MKMMKHSEPQILGILRQAEGGVPVAELCCENDISTVSLYKCGMEVCPFEVFLCKPRRVTDASVIAQTMALEDENRRLKRMFAELSMQDELLKEGLYRPNGICSG